ncbi:META domain-containing protein [Blastococcus saxobsidens]|nr:META domain-containing protein [Blastococcus saxobsidens]
MRLVAVLLLGAALLTACGGGAGGPDVRGEWHLVEGAVDGSALPSPGGATATLRFEAQEVRGRSFCNSFFASYRLSGDSLVLDGLGSTEMGCEPDVMAAETAFLGALARTATVTREGADLVLGGDGVRLRFSPVPPTPDRALADTRWVLETLVDGETASSTTGEPAVLVLRSDGGVEASTGCRSGAGTWLVDAGVLVLDGLAPTGDCPPELAAQDAHVAAVLGGRPAPAIDGDRLTLSAPDARGLVYRAEAEGQREDGLLGSWELIAGTADGHALPLPGGARATLTFSAGSQTGGTSFCNGYGGDYAVDGDELRFEEVAVSLVLCEGPVGEAEGAYLDALLDRTHRFTVDADRLRLSSPAGELTFRRLLPPPLDAVSDRRWLLESVGAGGTAVPATGDASLELRSGGTAAVTTGCRSFEATWRTGGDTVHLADWEYELLDCPPEVAGQDQALVDVLAGGFQLRVDGDRLVVDRADGRGAPAPTLVYRAER